MFVGEPPSGFLMAQNSAMLQGLLLRVICLIAWKKHFAMVVKLVLI